MTKHISLSRFTPSSRGIAGAHSRKLQGMKIGKFGAASKGRRLEGEARRAVTDRLRLEGQIS
jgi:hypothetical protein